MPDTLLKHRSSLAAHSIELAWWFLSLLTISLYFKYSYLSYLYHEGLFAVAGGGTSFSDRMLFLLLLAGRDILEVTCLIALAYFAMVRICKVNLTLVIVSLTLILGLIGTSNLMSFQQLQNFVTIQNIQISVSWFLADTSLLGRYFSLENAILCGVTVAWLGVTVLLPRLIQAIESDQVRKVRSYSAAIGFASYVLCAGILLVFYHLPYNPKWWLALVVGAILSPVILWLLTGFIELCSPLHSIRKWTLPVLGAVIIVTTGIYWAIGTNFLTKQHPINAGHWSEIAKSLAGAGMADPLSLDVPEIRSLLSNYETLAFPAAPESEHQELLVLPVENRIPRHIVIVSLETAASRYYPLLDNPRFPAFQEMGRSALVSEQHQTNIPFTTHAAYSILSGIYAWPSIKFSKYGELQPDSLPAVLKEYGYESTYIDAFLINWQAGQRQDKLLKSIGFDVTTDESGDDDIRNQLSYADKLQREANAFRKATEKIAEAEAKSKKAFVFVQSQLGHYSWAARPGHENDPAAERIHNITRDLDSLFGRMISSLDASGLTDDIIIVVTGDHGLRFSYEFQTLGHEMSHSDLEFNVPLFIYSPGLLDQALALPYMTSHIDIAPTLLSLVGVSENGLLHHGMNMLDQRIADRATFLMNTGLSPVDGFHWRGKFLTYNKLTGEISISAQADRSDKIPYDIENSTLPRQLQDVPSVIDRASEIFKLSNIYFLEAHE